MQAWLHEHTERDNCGRNPDRARKTFKTARHIVCNRCFCCLTARLRVICDLCISMPIHICTSTNLQLPCIALTHIIQCSHYICDLIQLTLKHTCAGCAQTSRYVFTYRLVHGIVQITMHVTFRCTFHRAPNQHINRDTWNTLIHAGCHQQHTIMHI